LFLFDRGAALSAVRFTREGILRSSGIIDVKGGEPPDGGAASHPQNPGLTAVRSLRSILGREIETEGGQLTDAEVAGQPKHFANVDMQRSLLTGGSLCHFPMR